MKRSKFSLSYYNLLSMELGVLVPCGLLEVLPGDTVQQATNALIRFAPMLAPVMHPMHARIHHWYVPHRLVWEDWEDFITGGSDGMDASVFPTITSVAGFAVGGLHDYMGVPPGVANTVISALPARGYNLIWNEWYRDQDLQSELVIDLGSGADTTTAVGLQSVCWEKDYFTTSRPWEQKGPTISVPVSGLGTPTGAGSTTDYAGANAVKESAGLTAYANAYASNDVGSEFLMRTLSSGGLPDVNLSLSNLREAFALLRFEEARARFGSRYTEYLRYLGVRSSDARLQRPEYLGGGKQTIQFSEVLQTAPTAIADNEDVGTMRGHGIGGARSNRYRRFFEEHGYVFSFLSIKPKSIYTDGLYRTWNRRTKEDFWQRELEHIGQQAVLNKEIYSASSAPTGVWGYQDRYDEYRRSESHVSGEFRTSALDFWHFAREFSGDTALNAQFVSCDPPTRPFASTETDTVYCMVNHSIQARRLVGQSGAQSRVF